jgi:hypothetical protein
MASVLFLDFFGHRSRGIVEYGFDMLSFNNVIIISNSMT